jgi:hypothetical protein
MPELPILPHKMLARALEKKGFVLGRIKGSRHNFPAKRKLSEICRDDELADRIETASQEMCRPKIRD